MRINYSDKINNDQHMVVISTGNNKINSNKSLDIQSEKLLNDYLAEKTSDKEIIETFFSRTDKKSKPQIKCFSYARFEYKNDDSYQQSFFEKFLYFSNL